MSKKYLLEILENNKPILQPTAASIQFLLNYSKAMDVKKFKIPKGVVVDINRTKTAEEPKNQGKMGTIHIQFSNYNINSL